MRTPQPEEGYALRGTFVRDVTAVGVAYAEFLRVVPEKLPAEFTP